MAPPDTTPERCPVTGPRRRHRADLLCIQLLHLGRGHGSAKWGQGWHARNTFSLHRVLSESKEAAYAV